MIWPFAIYLAKIISISCYYFYMFEREEQHWSFWIVRIMIFIFVMHDFIQEIMQQYK